MARTVGTPLDETEKLKNEIGSTFEPGWSLLYFFKMNPQPNNPAGETSWLVGYRLGRDGHTSVNRAVVIDDSGKTKLSLPESLAGDDAVTVELKPNTWAIAVTHENRFANETVVLWTLEPPHRILFRYGAPKDVIWESTLYFVDRAESTTKSVLVRRTVRTLKGKLLRHEHLIYVFDDKSTTFAHPRPLTESDFDQLLKRSQTTGPVPEINQYGPPYEVAPAVK